MEKAILWMVALSMVALQACRQIYSGQCGSGLTWTLDDGTLVIEGQGAMEDWGHGTETPWFEYRGDIRVVVIKDGVTHIGDHAFPCQSMVSVTIPGSVTSIGEWAFSGCTGLTSVTFEGTFAEWNAISKWNDWNFYCPFTEVVCSDGTVRV